MIQNKDLHLVCQTESLVNGLYANPYAMDEFCRKTGISFIYSQCFGVWGTIFLNFGAAHIITDGDGIATK